MAKPRSSDRQGRRRQGPDKARLYTLEVALRNGPITPRAHENTATVSRSIQIRADQALADLHQAILTAFERPEDYSYEFQLDTGPMHPEGKRYVLPGAFDISVEAGSPAAGCVTDTSIDDLGLQVGQQFIYSPDREDDWWHLIRVDRIAVVVPKGKYPKVTKRVGKSPFQAEMQHHNSQMIGTDEGADTACLVAEMHLSQGEYHKAVEAFTRAIAMNPTVDAYEGRARAYRALAAADEQVAQQLRQR